MFKIDLLIVNGIKALLNEVAALNSLKYIIIIGFSTIGASSFLEVRRKMKK